MREVREAQLVSPRVGQDYFHQVVLVASQQESRRLALAEAVVVAALVVPVSIVKSYVRA